MSLRTLAMQQGAYEECKTNEGNFAGACKDFKIDAALEAKMIQLFVNLISSLLLAALVWRKGRARLPRNSKAVRYFKIAGALLLGAQVAIYALFGFGEIFGGDWSGAGHLLQALIVTALAVLAWLRPREGGLALLIGVAAFVLSFAIGGSLPPVSVLSASIVIIAVPQALAGLCFWQASRSR